MDLKKLVLKYAPIPIQNFGISIYNTYQYRLRRGGNYPARRKYYEEFQNASHGTIAQESQRRLDGFLRYVTTHSPWYSDYSEKKLGEFPVLEKIDLLQNLDKILTIKEVKGVINLTGGTTGASMKVVHTKEDVRSRHAALDYFRAQYGYELGKKTAWFSGKDFVRPKDYSRGVFYRDDYINKIRFFSTFHINNKTFDNYWDSFKRFSPEFMVGFPSSVYDLCCMALERGLDLKGVVRTFFPTAETVLAHHRETIGAVLGCQIIDQYASSEGAPFIFECPFGSLHMHTLTGIFEVVDEEMRPTQEGELLVTAFDTRGTPLIRYRIGDRVKLASTESICRCGSVLPMVENIDGRSSDFIYSQENGRVNLGNISNATKDIVGIQCFQIIQREVENVELRVVGGKGFNDIEGQKFIKALKQRLGGNMIINFSRVDEIIRERSGKFRIVKNLLP